MGFGVAVLVLAGALPATLTTAVGVGRPKLPAADCQPFASTPCLLPFPDNRFTRPDRSTPTGLRVHLRANAMPVNTKGQRIGVGHYDRNDGFSPGSAIVVHVPGLDNAQAFARTGAVGLLNMKRAFARGQPIVVIDEATARRELIYSQLDANAPTPQDTNLMILPGKELAEGHTYVVALRQLRNDRGRLLAAPAWFQKLRDGLPLPASERAQRARYARIFVALRRAGINRAGLYEAWNFTVGSEKSLTSRLLSIRNDAFDQLGDHNLGNGVVQGNAPRLHDHQHDRPQLTVARRSGHVPGALLSDQVRLDGHHGISLQLGRSRRTALADPGQRRDRCLRVHRPQYRLRRPIRRASLSTDTGCSRTTRWSPPSTSSRWLPPTT